MMTSRPFKKRAHDSMSASKASSDLMASLSSSLHQMLLCHPTTATTAAAAQSEWLDDALTKVGVSSNVAALKLWSEYGRENDEQFCDARYLLWVCQHVLFDHHADTNDAAVSSSLDVLQSWQESMETLINNDDDDNDDHGGEMGVMWQMLLHSLHLTPRQLQSAYRKALEYNPRIRNIDDISYCFMWPSFFKAVVDEALTLTVSGGSKDKDENYSEHESSSNIMIHANNKNKRQKKSHHDHHDSSTTTTTTRTATTHQSNRVNTAWWPLLGYSITHAILSSNQNNNSKSDQQLFTIQQKLLQVQTAIMESLPSLMGIPCLDYVKKHSLLSGVVACFLDVLGGGL